MISWIKFRGDRLKGLEPADDCSNVEEGKRWNLQADILLCLLGQIATTKNICASSLY